MVKWTKGPNASEPHLETSRLVLFIDGQLSKAESAAAQSHLDLCDSCRAELAGIQDALSAYVDYRKCEYSEGLTPPPNGWRHFDGKLRQCAIDLAHTAPRSVFKEAVPSRTANARFHNLFRLPIDRIPVPVLAGVAFALLVVFTLFFFLKSAGKLSAAEIITKATSVQNRNASAIRRPIVYRKVRLRRISSRPDPDASITMETWIDELSENSRVRESVGKWSRISSMNRHQSAQSVPVHPADTRSRHAAPGITAQQTKTDASAPPLLQELQQIYSSSNLRLESALSPTQFAAWSDSVPNKKESVEKILLENGDEGYSVKTATRDAAQDRPIREIDLIVRIRDWHAVIQALTVATDTGKRTYEIAELDYRLIPMSELRPDIFGESSTPPLAAGPGRTLARPQPASLTAEFTLETQIEALNRLDRVDALAQDQLGVSRTAAGAMEIRGVVPTQDRKMKVLAALGELTSNPAIKIEIGSAEDVVVQHEPRTSGESQTQAMAVVVTPGGNPDLRRYLTSRKQLSGTALDEEMQRFASDAVEHSVQAQLDALALKQVVNSFSAADLESIGATARQQWRELVTRRVKAVHGEIAALVAQLAPVFAPPGFNAGNPVLDIEAGDDLKATVEALCTSAAANDKVLWKAFSSTADEEAESELKSLGFWNRLRTEALLAEAIIRKANE